MCLWGTGSVWVAVSIQTKKADELNHAKRRGEVRGWLWMWEWAEGRGGGNSNQRKRELRTLPKQGCVEQMLGAGVDICLIKTYLAWMLKWRARGMWEDRKAWVADKDEMVSLEELKEKLWLSWRVVGMGVSRCPSLRVQEDREGSVWCHMGVCVWFFFQEQHCVETITCHCRHFFMVCSQSVRRQFCDWFSSEFSLLSIPNPQRLAPFPVSTFGNWNSWMLSIPPYPRCTHQKPSSTGVVGMLY